MKFYAFTAIHCNYYFYIAYLISFKSNLSIHSLKTTKRSSMQTQFELFLLLVHWPLRKSLRQASILRLHSLYGVPQGKSVNPLIMTLLGVSRTNLMHFVVFRFAILDFH